MKLALALLIALLLVANCPPGSTFVPDGGYWCGWDDTNTFVCDPTGECVSDCYPSECADAAIATTPSATTKVKKNKNGKLHIVRWVVHTTATIDPTRPHVWTIPKNPDTGKPMSVPVPVKGTLTPKLQAMIARYESALAEEFPPKK